MVTIQRYLKFSLSLKNQEDISAMLQSGLPASKHKNIKSGSMREALREVA